MTIYLVRGGTAAQARRQIEDLFWDGLVIIESVRPVWSIWKIRRMGWEVRATVVGI